MNDDEAYNVEDLALLLRQTIIRVETMVMLCSTLKRSTRRNTSVTMWHLFDSYLVGWDN
ncbi:hypothetical protein F444_02140 [Phytophthora nicotianae P1976]|uniref:Uncharacterized protein n=1 Tax=Phytophthora nicotianae P1976 TaxID=1317066 RepID=A0A081AYF4_PHYNI|nr:hypothetical protein F444_02140 [Phytophthora nicotianae P1976]